MFASHGALLLPRRKTYAAIQEACNYTFVEIGYPFGATGRKGCSLHAAAVAKIAIAIFVRSMGRSAHRVVVGSGVLVPQISCLSLAQTNFIVRLKSPRMSLSLRWACYTFVLFV